MYCIQQTNGGSWTILKDQQMRFGFMDVILLYTGHKKFRPLMWPSSGWWQ
jgi:hypothetical protein